MRGGGHIQDASPRAKAASDKQDDAVHQATYESTERGRKRRRSFHDRSDMSPNSLQAVAPAASSENRMQPVAMLDCRPAQNSASIRDLDSIKQHADRSTTAPSQSEPLDLLWRAKHALIAKSKIVKRSRCRRKRECFWMRPATESPEKRNLGCRSKSSLWSQNMSLQTAKDCPKEEIQARFCSKERWSCHSWRSLLQRINALQVDQSLCLLDCILPGNLDARASWDLLVSSEPYTIKL